ncbi:hypothetical protein CPC08DRAFT_713112 [Agrocybe pediades]|nr:hypothetical protein CPC08DRAFT_713112 [Agrocybe pediades]
MWRAWVVWNRDYLVMTIPFCISCIAFGFGFPVLPKVVALLDVTSLILICVNGLLCTGLIVGRILYVNTFPQRSCSLLKSIRKSPYRMVIFLLCETGVLNAFITIATIVLFQLKSKLLIIALDFVVPVMAIVVLVALNVTMPHDEQTVDSTSRLETLHFHHTVGDASIVMVDPWVEYHDLWTVQVLTSFMPVATCLRVCCAHLHPPLGSHHSPVLRQRWQY